MQKEENLKMRLMWYTQKMVVFRKLTHNSGTPKNSRFYTSFSREKNEKKDEKHQSVRVMSWLTNPMSASVKNYISITKNIIIGVMLTQFAI